MLRKLSAALLATALIAGPAFASDPAGPAGSTPAASTAPAPTNAVTKPAAKPIKTVKHVRHHTVRHKVGKIKPVRHFRSTKHGHHIAVHVAKPGKFGKGGRLPAASTRS